MRSIRCGFLRDRGVILAIELRGDETARWVWFFRPRYWNFRRPKILDEVLDDAGARVKICFFGSVIGTKVRKTLVQIKDY